MIVSPIKTYSYKTFGLKSGKSPSVQKTVETKQVETEFNNLELVSFKGNSQNWTEGTLKGYDEQLRYIQSILIDPIKDVTATAAPIVIVYSPDKDVAQLVKTSVEKSLTSSVNKISANTEKTFNVFLNNALNQGRANFLSSGKKSILFLDKIENYISASDKEIPRLKKDFNDIFSTEDFEKIRQNGNNIENINILKSTADYCSGLPKRATDISSATSIFSIAQSPQIIDSELLRRPEKVYTIVFSPLYGEAFANILKNEVLKYDSFVQNIRYLPNKDIEKLEMPYKSWRNLQKIKNSTNKNPLDLNTSKIPFDVIAQFCSPDDKYGAFLTKQIPGIVQKATYKYIENPEKDFLQYLLKELKTTKRMLTPENLERENKIKNFVEYKQKANIIDDLNQIDKMLKAYIAGFIPAKKINDLVSEIVNTEIDSVKNGITQEDTFAKLKYKSVLDKLKSEYIISRIDQLSENRYKFSYQDGETDYVDLYLGSFGWGKETLWVNSSDIKKIELTRHFINEIKSLDEFKDVKVIEFPMDEKPKNELYKPTGRITIDKKPIYYIDLKEKETNKEVKNEN